MTIKRLPSYPYPEFKTTEEANEWAKKLVNVLQEDGTLRIQDIQSEIGSHAHAASDITSGTLVHEQGGLEADVGAYNGLLKISSGTTSAVTDGSTNWNTAYTHSQLTSGNPHSVSKSDVSLGSVEDTALSTWAGTSNITTLGTITQTSWTAPSLLNSWANYGGAYNSAGYFKDSLGIVHLRGLVKDGTIGQSIFTLPAGYRPTANEVLVTISNGAIGRIDIAADGNVYATTGDNTWFSLDGVTFRVA